MTSMVGSTDYLKSSACKSTNVLWDSDLSKTQDW